MKLCPTCGAELIPLLSTATKLCSGPCKTNWPFDLKPGQKPIHKGTSR